MKGRIGKCPRCGKVYEIQSLYVDTFIGEKKDLGTIVTRDEEYFCQRCQDSLRAWRQMDNPEETEKGD